MASLARRITGRLTQEIQLTLTSSVVLLGLFAIYTDIPTRTTSTTLAGALFGAGAAFVGGWVAERNRSIADRRSELRRQETARRYFAPELARIVGESSVGS